MTWRYQPVWVEIDGGESRSYTLAYVDVDATGALRNWRQTEAIKPRAQSVADLTQQLAMMLTDASLYKPVAFSSLKYGMAFEKVGT